MLVYIGSSSKTKKNNFYLKLHCPSWVIYGPGYNIMVCSQWHGSLFEDYVTTSKRDRYNIIFPIEAHERNQKSVNDEASSGGGRPLTYNSTEDSLI